MIFCVRSVSPFKWNNANRWRTMQLCVMSDGRLVRFFLIGFFVFLFFFSFFFFGVVCWNSFIVRVKEIKNGMWNLFLFFIFRTIWFLLCLVFVWYSFGMVYEWKSIPRISTLESFFVLNIMSGTECYIVHTSEDNIMWPQKKFLNEKPTMWEISGKLSKTMRILANLVYGPASAISLPYTKLCKSSEKFCFQIRYMHSVVVSLRATGSVYRTQLIQAVFLWG